MKIIITFIFVIVSFIGFSQEMGTKTDTTYTYIPLNELKLNAPFILGEYIEISYERSFNNQSSAGISAGFSFGEFPQFFAITPYYRIHFDDFSIFYIPMNNVFFEVNTSYYKQSIYDYDFDKRKEFTDFGIGIGFGKRFENRHGFVLELYTGLGKGFINNSFYPRVGINIGKKF